MKVGVLSAALYAGASAEKSNPMSTVLSLIDDLAAKLTKDAEAEQKAYVEYFEWCDETSKNIDYAVKTAEGEKEELEAKIGELTAKISAATSKIEELAGSVAQDQKELEDATVIRAKENKDFAASEGELMEAIDALGRAIGILSKEMAKNPAAFAQVDTRHIDVVVQALGSVLEAASFPSHDQKKLMAFVQSQQTDEDDDVGAPAGAVYKTHSGNILDVLEDLKEKAEGQLSDLRKAEKNTAHNFAMLKQSLEDSMAADTKDMEDEKASRSNAEESKATAEGDLDVTKKSLTESNKELAATHKGCLEVAADHEATIAARADEMKAIQEAKKILQETSSGAVEQSYSFLQLSSSADLAGSEVVTVVKRLAKTQHSAALAQLASRISTVLRFGGADPFGKVKGLIQDMLAKLEKQADEEAEEKAFCDEQMAKTEQKKSELEQDVAKQTSRIDQAAADSDKLKDEVKTLEAELAALAKEQAEMDKIRADQHASYKQSKADLTLGLSGVRKALDVLRDYYGSASMLQDDSFMQQPARPETFSKSSGAGGSIINILEVCESDFATNLAKEEQEEADSQSEYEKISQENAVAKTTKEQAVKYKSQEAKARDATVAEYSGDRKTTNKELDAVNAYYAKIKDRCVAVPETYAERKARREAEIAGLKQALSILEDETAFVQRKKHGSFRGTLSAQ